MSKKEMSTQIFNKSRNNFPVRVIYKKVGQAPHVKIIKNISTLKKAIIKRKLDIIPYEGSYIICNNSELMKYKKANIVLPFRSIRGDLVLVNIDTQEREFNSLSQEDIIWFTKDLVNKSPFPLSPNISHYNKQKISSVHERDFEESRSRENYFNNITFPYIKSFNKHSFETSIINVLTNLELVLASILKNNRNGDNKNG